MRFQVVLMLMLALMSYLMFKLVSSARKIPKRGSPGRGPALRMHKKYASWMMYLIAGAVGIVESMRIAGVRAERGAVLDLHLALAFAFCGSFLAAGYYNGIIFPSRHPKIGRAAYWLFIFLALSALPLVLRI